MSWVIAAYGVIISSVILYLFVRKAKLQNISVEMQNFGMFFLPTIIFMLYNIITNITFVISAKFLLIIAAAAIFLSWTGNTFSLKALESAPNPGYSLIISKSYVVLTSILSVWIFNSPLTVKDIIAISIIIVFSAFIMINKSSSKTKSISWLFYTIGAFLCWAFLAITLTYLLLKGLQSTQILFYIMLFVSILIIMEIVSKKNKVTFEKNKMLTLLAIGILSAIFNLCLVLGYKLAPNPGYINAANAGSISLVTIFSAIIFKDELGFKKIVGVLGVLCGLILLFIK